MSWAQAGWKVYESPGVRFAGEPRGAAVRARFLCWLGPGSNRVRGASRARGCVVRVQCSKRASERERESRAPLFCLAAAVSSSACRSSSQGLFGEDSGGRRGVGGLWWSCVLGLCTGAFCRVRGTRALRARAP